MAPALAAIPGIGDSSHPAGDGTSLRRQARSLAVAAGARGARFGARQSWRATKMAYRAGRALSRRPWQRFRSTGYSLWSSESRLSLGSIRSHQSAVSILSMWSFASVGSVGSAGSVLSIGSAGSMLSIGSVGSVLSIGSVGSVLAIGGRNQRPAILRGVRSASAAKIVFIRRTGTLLGVLAIASAATGR